MLTIMLTFRQPQIVQEENDSSDSSSRSELDARLSLFLSLSSLMLPPGFFSFGTI